MTEDFYLGIRVEHCVMPGYSEIDIAVGHTLSSPRDMGMISPTLHCTEERYLPRILVAANVFETTSDVRRMRPDLLVTFPDDWFRFLIIVIGKRHKTRVVNLLVGSKTSEARDILREEIRQEDLLDPNRIEEQQ
jgi:hypothetical protein